MSQISETQSTLEPFGVSPKKACVLLDCGQTKLFALIKAGELESYLDGRSRKITTRSIRARQQALLSMAA